MITSWPNFTTEFVDERILKILKIELTKLWTKDSVLLFIVHRVYKLGDL